MTAGRYSRSQVLCVLSQVVCMPSLALPYPEAGLTAQAMKAMKTMKAMKAGLRKR